jgi:hypothetical protein
LIFF